MSQFIARLGCSIRWKFEASVIVIAVLFLVISIINKEAMDFMHSELHEIQELMRSPERGQLLVEIDALEDTQHGFFYQLLPFLGVLGVLGASAIGASLALSVVGPVRGIGRAMRGFALGDFSQRVEVENKDELGELAGRVNQTGEDLARLQEATLAEEQARALQERIARVTLAQEEERRQISRELHDGLGPSLAAIGNRLRACKAMVRADPEKAERELDEVAGNLKDNVQEIRELIHGLRPLALDQLGLVGALGQHIEQFKQQTGMRIALNTSGEPSLDPLVEITVFRIVQECLTNVQKHSEASEVEVSIDFKETSLEARVKDNGKGFDTRDVTPGVEGKGMGILSMQERAELLGGSVSVKGISGGGSQVILYVPLREVEVGAD